MLRSLQSGVSGLQQFQERMDVIGNNVANVNTTGYKTARTELADSFSQVLSASSGSAGAAQVGTGVSTSAVRNVFTQGAITRTGLPTDLAVSGEGYFIVRQPDSGEEFATRAGDFRLNEGGYLVTHSGHRVQGFTDGQLNATGDIRIDGGNRPATADPTASMVGYNIDTDGKVYVQLSDGTRYVRGQVLLQNFRDPQMLSKDSGNLYSNLQAAGPALASGPSAPGSNGLGRIQSGALEMSNVDLTNEFASLISTQRAFQSSARIITVTDDMLQEVVNLKR